MEFRFGDASGIGDIGPPTLTIQRLSSAAGNGKGAERVRAGGVEVGAVHSDLRTFRVRVEVRVEVKVEMRVEVRVEVRMWSG